jgi:UDP-3-O-[3-hydroxymyristoyl] glucosamine N-acyltransferase
MFPPIHHPTGRWTLNELAGLLSVVQIQAEVVGDGTVEVTTLSHPLMIESPDDLVYAADPQIFQVLGQGKVKAALVPDELTPPEGTFQGYLKVARPKYALAALLHVFEKPVHASVGVHPSAVVEPTAKLGENVSVGPFVYVGEHAVVGENTILMSHVTVSAKSKVGADCLIYDGVRIGERVIVGNQVIIHHNASLGADGFSFVTPEAGSIESAKATGGKIEAQNSTLIKIKSLGTVVIEDDVEIGACTTIDRSNLGATLIKKGTKIDNLVMVGHNNTIGENCLIVSQVGVAGSCKIGDRVVLAGQVGLKDHLKIGEDAIVMARAGVMWDVEPKAIVVGEPAEPYREYMRKLGQVNNLGKMTKDIRAMKKQLEALESRLAEYTDTDETEAKTPVQV